jgi:hypothetical protein
MSTNPAFCNEGSYLIRLKCAGFIADGSKHKGFKPATSTPVYCMFWRRREKMVPSTNRPFVTCAGNQASLMVPTKEMTGLAKGRDKPVINTAKLQIDNPSPPMVSCCIPFLARIKPVGLSFLSSLQYYASVMLLVKTTLQFYNIRQVGCK